MRVPDIVPIDSEPVEVGEHVMPPYEPSEEVLAQNAETVAYQRSIAGLSFGEYGH